MNRKHRVLVLAIVGVTVFAACRRQQETPPPPAPEPTPVETCDSACRAARADSIRRAREADSLRRVREAEEAARRAAEQARNVLTAKIYFDYDQSEIRPDQRATLDAKIPVLRANPAVRILISGHADERGSDEYNIALGQARAAAARRYLTDNGIDPSRIQITSYGEERPAVQGKDESAYAQNRRAEFEIIAGGENLVLGR